VAVIAVAAAGIANCRHAGCDRAFDAEEKYQVRDIHTEESKLCHSGEVLKGKIKPNQCPAFGKECTPRNPLGATMVSSEGACAAYYQYGRFIQLDEVEIQAAVG